MNKTLTLEDLIAGARNPEVKPIEKAASENEGSGPAAELQALLSKTPSTSEETTAMTKSASAVEQGKAIAAQVLGMLKAAQEDAPAASTNQVVEQTAALAAQQSAELTQVPREGNTVTQTLKAIVAQGAARGAVDPEALSEQAVGTADETQKVPGALGQDAVERIGPEEEAEVTKLATVIALMDEGSSLYEAVALVKQAEDSMSPTSGPEQAANQVHEQSTAQVVQAAAQLTQTPRDGLTVTETLKALVAQGAARGGVDADALSDQATGEADETQKVPGALGQDAVERIGPAEEAEKVAAVNELLSRGYDLFEAVDMVKSATEDMAAAEAEQIKVAAVNELMEQGYDLESAVDLVKQAFSLKGAGEKLKGIGRGIKNVVGDTKTEIEVARGKFRASPEAVSEAKRNLAIKGGVAAAGVGLGVAGTRMMSGQEKAAAISTLVADGYDLDEVLALVTGVVSDSAE